MKLGYSYFPLTKLRHIMIVLTNNFCFLNKLIYAALYSCCILSHDIESDRWGNKQNRFRPRPTTTGEKSWMCVIGYSHICC